MLTHEELDRSRAIEAQRRACLVENSGKSREFSLLHKQDQHARILTAKLAREGWVPVDPKLIRAREICASQMVYTPRIDIMKGDIDNTPILKAVLVALNEK